MEEAQPPPPVPVAFFRVESGNGHSLAVVNVRDRRNSGRAPLIKWVYQKQLEWILFHSSGNGALWKLLNQASLGRTTLACDRAAVNNGILADVELVALLKCFKESVLNEDMIDPCSRNKVRAVSLVPLAAASAVCRLYGRSEASTAFLRAASQPIPQLWEMEQLAEGAPPHARPPLLCIRTPLTRVTRVWPCRRGCGEQSGRHVAARRHR